MTFDAVQFLESLFRSDTVVVKGDVSTAYVALPEMTPADLSGDWFVLWDERAAIMEYDGDMPRELAEHFALLDVLQMMKTDGIE